MTNVTHTKQMSDFSLHKSNNFTFKKLSSPNSHMISLFTCTKFFPVKDFSLRFKPKLVQNPQQQTQFQCCSSSSSSLLPVLAISQEDDDTEDSSGNTINYLMYKCGLSQESAIVTSKKIQFKTLNKPESVLTLLRKYEFSKAQIAQLVRKRPLLLLADPQKSILPKLEFLKSIGVSDSYIARFLSSDPTFLTRSLKNQILPAYDFLKSVLQSNSKVVASLRRTSWIFLDDYTKNLGPNVEYLREFGVKESCLVLLLAHFPEALMRNPEEFKGTVVEVSELGFDPSKSMFVLAIHVLSGNGNKSIRERCSKIYKSWGWSDDEIRIAFRKHPNCMMLSEKKINRAMEFLVKEMNWNCSEIAKCPTVLFFNLEKRIIPRCSVIELLLSKSVLKKESVSLSTVLLPKESNFLEKFVIKYEEEVPELFEYYEDKKSIVEV